MKDEASGNADDAAPVTHSKEPVEHDSRCLARLTIVAALTLATHAALAQTSSGMDAVKAATDRMNAIKAATGATPSANRLPPGDPCTALNQATLQGMFPGVRVGERSKRLEDFGMTECQWSDGKGDVVLVLKESYDAGGSAKEDASGMTELYEGSKGAANVRIETFPTIGLDNAGFFEAPDAAHGVKNAAAFIELRKGRHVLTIGAPGLNGRERAQGLKNLEAMGRLAASRM